MASGAPWHWRCGRKHHLRAAGGLGDLGAALELRRVLAEEGAEQAGAGRLLHLGLVVHDVDQRREAHRIRQQDEFLARRRARLAHLGHELDALDPFRRRQVHLAREGVQVAHGRFHDLLHARVRRGRHLLEHGIGDRLRCVFAHRRSPLSLTGPTGRALGPNPAGITNADTGAGAVRPARAPSIVAPASSKAHAVSSNGAWQWAVAHRGRELIGDTHASGGRSAAHVEEQRLAHDGLHGIDLIRFADEESGLGLGAGQQPLGKCRYEDDRDREGP